MRLHRPPPLLALRSLGVCIKELGRGLDERAQRLGARAVQRLAAAVQELLPPLPHLWACFLLVLVHRLLVLRIDSRPRVVVVLELLPKLARRPRRRQSAPRPSGPRGAAIWLALGNRRAAPLVNLTEPEPPLRLANRVDGHARRCVEVHVARDARALAQSSLPPDAPPLRLRHVLLLLGPLL